MNNKSFAIEVRNDPPNGTEMWGPYESDALAKEVAAAFIANDSTWQVVPALADMEFSGCPM